LPNHPVQRMTPQRRVILDVLQSMPIHPTADEIYDAVRAVMPRISLATVYRNLDLLTEAGSILTLEVGNQKRYDGTVSDHAHIICRGCGMTADVPDKSVELIGSCLGTVAASVEGFEDVAPRLYFIGTCTECA
jgi:Fur family transcriptional regulator, ferric uptake regulator